MNKGTMGEPWFGLRCTVGEAQIVEKIALGLEHCLKSSMKEEGGVENIYTHILKTGLRLSV
jgi:hypothetical protein